MPAHILIIEDNPENLDLMTYLLTAFGYTVLKATDGEQGLFRAKQERLDLILCDLQMPKLDGFKVIQKIRDEPQLATLPVLAVTAYAMRDDCEKVMSAGFDGYIEKPIVPEDFVSQVETFLNADLRSGAVLPVSNTQQRKSEPGGRAVRATILAVDDRQVNLNLVRSILEPFGYKVIAVDTVKEGLRTARREPPDLILSDLHLPDEDGYQFLDAVRKDADLREIPFVLTSSSVPDRRHLAEGLARGATKVLFRPLEPEVLLREIETCLADK